jgi:predicted ArsR family transcriptional regulator
VHERSRSSAPGPASDGAADPATDPDPAEWAESVGSGGGAAGSAPPLTATEFASAVTAITSAFGDPTRREIYLFAHGDEADGVTAAEVAERFDLHPNVARHHLDKLAGGGYLEVHVSRDGRAGAGRPSKRYQPTGKQIAVEVPVRQDDVLITLLGRALTLLPREQAETMAEEVGIEYGRVMARSLGDSGEHQRSFRSALHAVADALTAHGFAAHAEKRNNELRIVSENCPFGGAAIENPVICAVDRGMVKGMLASLYGDTRPELESSIPMGDLRCITGVTANGPTAPTVTATP